MKRKLFALLTAALLLLFAALPASAAEDASFVFFSEGLLSDGEATALGQSAAEVSRAHNCGVYVGIYNDMADYGFNDIQQFAEYIYTEESLGFGEDSTGILLILSMAERDYDLAAYGNAAHIAFTDYGKEVLAESFLDNFRNDDWAGGFADYINACGAMLTQAETGNPVDVAGSRGEIYYEEPEPTVGEKLIGSLGIGLIVGVVVALIYCAILKRQMKSAVAAVEASEYIPDAGIMMTAETDHFTHTTVTRVHIDRDSDHHSGGTSVNSGGFSHSSGKF